MDPATISVLMKLAADLGIQLVNVLRQAGKPQDAGEIAAILTRTDAIAQRIIARADAELGTPTPPPVEPPAPPPVEPPPVVVDPDHEEQPPTSDPVDARLAVVQQVRAQYGAFVTAEQGVMIANEVAYRLNNGSINGPFGLQRSVPGDTQSHLGFAPRYVANYQQGVVYRILDVAPGTAEARWAVATSVAPAWMAPKPSWIPVGGHVDNVTVERDLLTDVADIAKRVAAVEADMARLKSVIKL